MFAHHPRLVFALVTCVLTAVPGIAKPQQPSADPLPKDAVVRFGATRPLLRTNPAVALVPPTYRHLLAPTINGGLRRYDLSTGKPLDDKGIVGPGRVVVAANGKRAAVARIGAVTVVDVGTGKRVLTVEPPPGVILAGTPGTSLSADGTRLAYGGRGADQQAVVVVCEVDRDLVLAQVEAGHPAPVVPLLSADGKTLATFGGAAARAKGKTAKGPMPPAAVDAARAAQVWDVATGKLRFQARVTGSGGAVVAAAFSPDGARLAVSAGDGPMDLWEVSGGKHLDTLLGRRAQGIQVAFAPDGKTLASIGPDYRIQRWTADGMPLDITDPPPGLHYAPVTGLVFADNTRVIAWQTDHQLPIGWEAPSGKLLSPFLDHSAPIRSIAIPDDKSLLSSGVDGRILRWDLATGRLNDTIPLHWPRIPGRPVITPVVTLSGDATRATWLNNPSEVFDLANGHDLFCVPPPSLTAVADNMYLSPDGMRLAAVACHADIRVPGACVVWDLARGRRLAQLRHPRVRLRRRPRGVV